MPPNPIQPFRALARGAMAAALALTALPAAAEGDRHHGHHAAHHADVMTAPKEAGQSAFAALAEIVTLLEADPDTDWSRVDLDALRRHLVHMDEVMLRADTVAEEIPGGLRVRVSGRERTLAAILAMVPAHARELDRGTDWSARTEVQDDAVLLEVVSGDPNQVARIRGLGFFGLMASGRHHQPHHLAIARGEPMHRH